jgi:Domain of unknown function (DUF4177)
MFEYKIRTQRDKTLSGAFDPTELDAALNAHAADGWRIAEGVMFSTSGEREERGCAHPRAALRTTDPAA